MWSTDYSASDCFLLHSEVVSYGEHYGVFRNIKIGSYECHLEEEYYIIYIILIIS